MSEFTVAQERKVVTSIPGPKSQALHQRRLEAVSAGAGAALPVYIEKAHGAIIVDADGNHLIDLGSGIGVMTIGHTNAGVVKAVQEQVANLTHTLFTLTPYEQYVEVCELLNKHTPGNFKKKSVLFNSGAEAVENAVKIARKATRKNGIVVFDHAYHGRTNLTFTMNFKSAPYGNGFGPTAPSIQHVPMSYPYRDPQGMTGVEAAQRSITYIEKRVGVEDLAAIVIEPIQGEGGIIPATAEFIRGVRELCDKHNALLVMDEVQTGVGRTGKLYAYMHYGVTPDILTTAKSLGGGFPIGAMLTTNDIASHLKVGTHGSTYGGNPLACAVAEAVIDTINTPDVMQQVLDNEQLFRAELERINAKYQVFSEVRGQGMLLGAVLNDTYKGRSREFFLAAADHGLMALVAGTDVVRFAPSLVITADDIHQGMQRFEQAVKQVVNG